MTSPTPETSTTLHAPGRRQAPRRGTKWRSIPASRRPHRLTTGSRDGRKASHVQGGGGGRTERRPLQLHCCLPPCHKRGFPTHAESVFPEQGQSSTGGGRDSYTGDWGWATGHRSLFSPHLLGPPAGVGRGEGHRQSAPDLPGQPSSRLATQSGHSVWHLADARAWRVRGGSGAGPGRGAWVWTAEAPDRVCPSEEGGSSVLPAGEPWGWGAAGALPIRILIRRLVSPAPPVPSGKWTQARGAIGAHRCHSALRASVGVSDTDGKDCCVYVRISGANRHPEP